MYCAQRRSTISIYLLQSQIVDLKISCVATTERSDSRIKCPRVRCKPTDPSWFDILLSSEMSDHHNRLQLMWAILALFNFKLRGAYSRRLGSCVQCVLPTSFQRLRLFQILLSSFFKYFSKATSVNPRLNP